MDSVVEEPDAYVDYLALVGRAWWQGVGHVRRILIYRISHADWRKGGPAKQFM